MAVIDARGFFPSIRSQIWVCRGDHSDCQSWEDAMQHYNIPCTEGQKQLFAWCVFGQLEGYHSVRS